MLRTVKDGLQRAGGSLAYREFRLFYVAVVSASMGNQIQRIVDLWVVYEMTGSTAYLALTGLARGIPIIVFSLAGGLIADRIDRKSFIMVMQLGSAAANLLLAALIVTGAVQLWHILVISMVSSSFVAISAPARTAITPALVPRNLLVNAFAFTGTAWKLAQIIGPALAGPMIAVAGSGVTYGFNGCVYLLSAGVLLFMSYRSVPATTGQSALKSLVEALSFLKRESVIAVLVSINQPFTIWMLRSFFQNIPADLDEAARVDGCTHFQAFRWVIMPVMWPGVITTGLFSFLLAYNDFLVCSLLLDAQNQTMVPAIAGYFNRETTTTDQVEAIAAAVSITAPLFLLVMIFQRQIVSGLTAGAVKG